MARPALRIEVTTKDRKQLRELLSGGVQPVCVVLRAVALPQLARGVSTPRISAVLPLTPQAIRKVGHALALTHTSRLDQSGPLRCMRRCIRERRGSARRVK